MKLSRETRYVLLLALGVHVISLVLPFGFASFVTGWQAFVDHLTGQECFLGGTWLLALSWLANPAIWAGMILLGRGRRVWAAVAGQIAVLLALCAVRVGYQLPTYYVWVAGMMLVVYPALLGLAPVAKDLRTSKTKPGRPVFAGMGPTLKLAFGLALLDGLLVAAMFLGGDSTLLFRPDEATSAQDIHTGDDARSRILGRATPPAGRGEDAGVFPASARNFWYYEGGNFNGDITYWMFECDSREDCLKAVEYLGALRPDDLKPWVPSRYSVVMEGLDFYTNPVRHPWNVREIKNGLVYEQVHEDRWMDYYAIDLDRNRVYYHHESGGFPTDEYRPDDAGEGHPRKTE